MNNTTRQLSLLFSLLALVFYVSQSQAAQPQCTKEDVVGQWTIYSIDIGVADHVEYQEKIDVKFLGNSNSIDQFSVSFSGAFSLAINPWKGECLGDQYVLSGEINAHNNIHAIQAFRNISAPATDQCSLERCEETCIADLLAECLISKTVLGRKLTFMFLPGHTMITGDGKVQYLVSAFGCRSHDCNHPNGTFHTHDGG